MLRPRTDSRDIPARISPVHEMSNVRESASLGARR
jgi:hypothetical protein